eukprot:3931237-Rhodomonas_salina.1
MNLSLAACCHSQLGSSSSTSSSSRNSSTHVIWVPGYRLALPELTAQRAQPLFWKALAKSRFNNPLTNFGYIVVSYVTGPGK